MLVIAAMIAVGGLLAAPAAASVTFGLPTDFATGFNPDSIAIADFNGDGNPDLVVANGESNDVSILLATGSGSFATSSDFEAGDGPHAVAVGDFNDDGSPDLAVANWGSNDVSILLGTGSGSFGTPTSFGGGLDPSSIAIGDFNGDGNLDLAVANYGSSDVSILLGTGSGSFATSTSFVAGTNSESIAIGDFNGDGQADLAVANETSNDVSILLGTGSGSFATPVSFSAGTDPGSIAIRDFNGDRNPDLAVANRFTSHVSILLGTGSGSFATPVSFSAGNNPRSIAIGDFNGDGNPDLVVANERSNGISVLLGDGYGSFGAATNFAAGTRPSSIVVGDFNDDGDLDLAVTNEDEGSSHGSVLLSSTAGVSQAATKLTLYSSRNPAPYGSSGNLTASVNVVAPGTGTPTGSVTFSEGSTVLTTVPLAGKIARCPLKSLAPGTHEIVATYSGDGNYEASESALLSQAITKAVTGLSLSSSRNPAPDGSSTTLSATVKVIAPGAGTPTGSVTFLEDGAPVATIPLPEGKKVAKYSLKGHPPGTDDFQAIYSGDGNYEASESALLTQTIVKASTALTLTSAKNPAPYGYTGTLKATVKAVAPGAGTPTGSVTFSEGATTLATVSLTRGSAQLSLKAFAPGPHEITATYSASANYEPSEGTLTQTIVKASTALTLTSAKNPAPYGYTGTLKATVKAVAPGAGTPTGSVTFSEGEAVLGVVPLAGNAATYPLGSLPPGSNEITASYGDSAEYEASQGTISQVITIKAPSTSVAVQVGSEVPVPAPNPLVSFTSTGTPTGNTSGLTIQVSDGSLLIAASAQASPGQRTLAVSGTGCTASRCGISFSMSVVVTVKPLAPPPGPLETLTEPSPDRVADGVAEALTDELLVTLGTPENPGSRVEAEADASAVGGIVSGGIDVIGVYEIRWHSPQDLDARRSALEALPGVSAVSEFTLDEYGADGATPSVSPEYDEPWWTWRFEQIEAGQAWSQTTPSEANGSDVTVGIIDAGDVFAGHQDLNVKETIADSVGPEEHATHVAGLACARGDNELGMTGVAPGCPIVTVGIGGLRGFFSKVLEAMTQMASWPEVKVVNISLGENAANGCATEFEAEQFQAHAEDAAPMFRHLLAGIGSSIVWTFSAGNNCTPGIPSPWGQSSDLGNVVVVGATNSDGSLASFSDYGRKVAVAAPGGVETNPPSGAPSSCKGLPCFGQSGLLSTTVSCSPHCVGDYGEIAGTSMAAPMVAGVAALVRSANPALTAEEAGECIKRTAGIDTGYTDERSSLPAGFTPKFSVPASNTPIVNAAAAVSCGQPSSGTPPAGSSVSAGFRHSCALSGDGVDCWGENFFGQAGNGTESASVPNAVPVSGLRGAVSVSSGTYGSCALLSNGSVSCWGGGEYGSLGNGGTKSSSLPVQVSGISNATELSFGGLTGCVLIESGAVECWGFDSDGQLGDSASFDNNAFRSTPAPVSGISNATAISTGYNQACALLADGTVKCWGRDTNGQLGDGQHTSTSTPVQVKGITNAVAVSAGGYHDCALLADGTVECWGNNNEGQLGNGTIVASATPVPVSGITTATAISAGRNHTCALLESGAIDCWGANEWGELGNPDGSSHKPVPVSTITNAVAVSAGGFHTCAKLASGTIECWGRNTDGQLGNGSTTGSTTPVVVAPFP